MRTLYAAFKGTNNTSCQLVAALNRETLLLTNSFQGIERDIGGLCFPYDSVVMFGVDKTLTNGIKIEGCAEHNGETIYSTFDMNLLTHKCNEVKIPFHILFKPTKYLCNFAYWHMLRKVPNTIFMHIPSIRGMNPDFMKLLIASFRNLQ